MAICGDRERTVIWDDETSPEMGTQGLVAAREALRRGGLPPK
jgi:hypothetical protein